MTDARTDAPAVVGRPRSAHVTAVVVTRGATEYLSSTLAALAAQTTAPDRLVVVDAADAADAEQVGALLSGLTGPELVIADSARTFGSAVRRALEVVDDPSAQGRRWLWLLHDDSAPEPTALAELLRAVEIAPSVAVAGCKQRTWSGPVRVLEVGVTTSRFGRRMTGLDEPEVDQGQHDGREDVLGVGLAGALVRRDVWDELGGTDPALGPYGDGLDLSRRARLAGHRVVVVPAAVVRHAQASLVPGARPDWDVRRSVRARREAYVHSQLVGVPGWLVPVVALLAVGAGVLRALGRLVTKEPQLVGAELVAPWAVLARPRRIASARSLAASTRRVARRTLRPLQGTWREVVSAERDRRLTAAEGRRTREAPSELELTELAALRTRRRAALAALLVAAVAVTAAAVGPLVTRVVAGARLSGDGLPFGDADLGALWSSATSGWAAGGLGAAGPSDPFLLTLVPLTALTGTVGGASAVVMLGALVLAALGAWFAAGAATRSVALRMWAALAWTGAPALLLGVDQGRLGAVVAHCMLPWVALGVARGVGAARIDAVESGLVGAQRVGQTAAPVDAGPQAGPVRAAARTAAPSLAAAAGAALALAVATAAAPLLLPASLLCLVVVAVVAPRRRRLVLVAAPSLALQGPVLVEAARTWSDGGWRLLVADPGVALSQDAAPSWQQLLGWPVSPPDWLALGEPWAQVVMLVAGATVLLVALAALAVAPPAVRAVRVGWLVAACGLAAALVAGAVEVAAAGTGDVLATAWVGSGVSLATLGMLTAALVGAAGVRGAMARSTFGWRQVLAAVVAVVAVSGPALVLGAWAADVRDGGGSLATSDVPVVPAVGVQMQGSPDQVRVLSLDLDADGTVRATVLRGDGVQITELSRAAAVREVRGALGATAPAAADAASAEVAEAAARLAAGSTGVADDLASLGIGAVLVPPAGDAEAAGRRTELAGRLDSTAGLERVTETAAGVIWRVSTDDATRTVAWARLVDGARGAEEGDVLAAVAARDLSIDVDIAPGSTGRLLVLAERADPGWRATLDGRPLRAVETSWRQAFEVPETGGRLVVSFDPPERVPWLALQGAVLLVTVLLAVPTRRRRVVR